MIDKRFACPKCECERYLVLSTQLLSDTEYGKHLKCRKCKYEWDEKLPLVSAGNKYAYVWDSDKKLSISLHRWVWEQSNGRSLSPIEVIHHRNRNKGDDRPANLALMDRYLHTGAFDSKQLYCKRCGHRWYPRQSEVRTCPKCRSPYWDKERR